MKREDVLKDMKNMVGQKDPVVFFEKMVDAFSLLFDQLDDLKNELNRVKVNSALSIQWDSRVANDMLAKQIEILRQDKDTYHAELSACKEAYARGTATSSYSHFVNFWLDTLGWHPFLDYQK